MENKLALLAAALVGAAALADLAAHRDEVVSRRIRELNPETVDSELDRIRNRRWHAIGFAQRAVAASLLAAVVALLGRSWLAFGLGIWIGTWTTALVFDIAYNIRMKLPWDYVGTTSVLDLKLATPAAARVAAAKELGLVMLGVIAWLIFI